MPWVVHYHPDFLPEFETLAWPVRLQLLALSGRVAVDGPRLGRPHADTLNASQYPNMKELRFKVDRQVWRAAFAFDPQREAVILVAADKQGVNARRFYKELIARADTRFALWLKFGGK